MNDAHIHLFADGYQGRYGRLLPDERELAVYEEFRRVHHIELALVVGYEGAEWSRGNNRYLARLKQIYPWIVPLAYCSFVKPLEPSCLSRWWDDKFYGISLYIFDSESEVHLASLSNQWVDSLNQKRAIISVNCHAVVAGRLRPLWERLHECTVLFSHLGLPGPMQAAGEKLDPLLRLADLSHLGVKLSGIYASNEYPHPGLSGLLDQMVDAYGEGRLYWGSDFAPSLDHITFQQSIDAIASHPWRNAQGIMGQYLASVIRRVRL